MEISSGSTQLEISNEDRAKLNQLFMLKSKKEIIRLIKNLFINYSYSLHEKIYDLIGEMLIENPKFFKKDLYHRLYKRFYSFLSSQEVSEMEEYILRKFCFYKGEEIITSSLGRLSIGAYEILGNFYITNRRLITSGIISNRWGSAFDTEFHPLLIPLIPAKYIDILRSRSWKKRLKKEIYEVKPCFGYELPYNDIYDIRRKKNRISFVLRYEYEDKGQPKTKTPKMRFYPSKIKRETALSKIYDVVNSIST